MKYMLLILDNHQEQAKLPASEIDRIVKEHQAFQGELVAKNILVDGRRLRPEISRIKVQKGKRVVVDGPFAETKEVLGGYYVIECASREEALSWAKKCPMFDTDCLELQPIWDE